MLVIQVIYKYTHTITLVAEYTDWYGFGEHIVSDEMFTTAPLSLSNM